MRLLAHRGIWRERRDANSSIALTTALSQGFGIEFDVRDAAGQLVVSHDLVEHPDLLLEELLASTPVRAQHATLAVNIKADGLARRVEDLLVKHSLTNYFCFDMSVPEMLQFQRRGLSFFTRQSEFEPTPVLYANAAGVWMDMFEKDWISASDILSHLASGKQVAIVSPELHGRPHMAFWRRLRDAGLATQANLMLCTDHPEAARRFFGA